MRALFDRQLHDQLDAGPPDFWIGETFSWLGEALLFVERARRTGLPVMVTMCFEQPEPRSYEGDAPAACAQRLAGAGADVVGVNCLNGPEQQLRIAVEMRGAVDEFVAAQPVAYRTTDARPDFTATVAGVVRSLPSSERSNVVIFTSNYGEAGAIDRFGPAHRHARE